MAKEKNSRPKTKKEVPERLLSCFNLILSAVFVICCFGIALRATWERKQIDPAEIVIPEWIEQEFLEPNEYSRAGKRLDQVRDIVVHYVANPGTTAMQNRNYFNSLAVQTEEPKVSVSSHFIIGSDGMILQCIPLGEVAYANYPRNYDTISIECCHPDESGQFTAATKASLIRLTAWLCDELELKERHIIRHYDVSGKECPKYYVDHEDEWIELQNDIKSYRK